MPTPGASTFCCCLTLFDEKGRFDEERQREHFRRLAAAGIGVYVGGSSPGEQYSLTKEEVTRLLRIAVEELSGRVPVRAMCVEPRNLKEGLALLDQAAECGVEAAQLYSLDVGHGIHPTEREIEAYLEQGIDRSPLPLALSSHVANGYLVPVSILERVLDPSRPGAEKVLALHVTTPDMLYLGEVVEKVGDRVDIYCGGVMHALTTLGLGGSGYLSGEANLIPQTCVSLIREYTAGRYEEAGRLLAVVLAVMRATAVVPGGYARRNKAAHRALFGSRVQVREPFAPVRDDEVVAVGESLRAVGERYEIEELIPR